MNATHTPGPWRVGEMCGGCINIEADTTPRHITVGRVHVFDTTKEAEANAHLIAEAPAMAAELSETLDLLRAIIDSGALKNVPHLSALVTDVMRSEAHERIVSSRAILARITGGSPMGHRR